MLGSTRVEGALHEITHMKIFGQCQPWRRSSISISDDGGDGDKGFGVSKSVLQHCSIALSDKKSDHIIYQGYLNLLCGKEIYFFVT